MAYKGSHLKCLPMVSARSQFRYPNLSGQNMVYYMVSTSMWILGRLYGEDVVYDVFSGFQPPCLQPLWPFFVR